jgi:hypothetical protein
MKRAVPVSCAVGACLALAACDGAPGAGCYYSLSRAGRGVPAAGGDVKVQVEAPAGCEWTYGSDDAWISVADAPPEPAGSGDGTVVVTVEPNAGVRRVGTAIIGFNRLTIDQAGTDGAGTCSFEIYPTAGATGPEGGPGAFAVVASAPDCGWWVEAHAPDDDWIDNDFHYGIGTGVATYQVAPGTVLPSLPLPRTGHIGLHNSTDALVVDHAVTENP